MTEQEWRETFAHRLRIIMRIKGLDQRTLANLAGIPEDSISRYKKCKRTPNSYIITKLANALECSVDELIEPF